MSKIKLPSRRLNLVLALLTCYFSVFAFDNGFIGTYSHDEIEQRLENLQADVDLKLTPDVKKYLHQYIVSYRQSSETLLGRSLIYFPDIENKITQKNLPTEIKFLSVIESSLKPAARSRVGAVGLWQFMKATAKMYGLKVDKHVDERKDVDKSTEAALEYLSDLNERFGDWTLALAAYNCGPGNVRKAMRRSGGNDYWSIRNYLPRETRNYVPKFIAVTYLMNYYHDHELQPLLPDELFVETRKAVIKESTTFMKIASAAGVDIEVIQYYNPSYVGNFIPKSSEGKILELPTQAMYSYLEAIQGFDLLVPDPMQELRDESELIEIEQLTEQRQIIEEVPEIGKASNLENFQLLYSSSRGDLLDLELEVVDGHKIAKRRQTLSILNRREKKREYRKQYVDKIRSALVLN